MIVSPARTRVLLALIAVYQRDGRATLATVAEAAGKSRSTTYRLLLALRDLGLIEWVPNLAGTLRPAVGPVGTHVRNQAGESTTMARELDDPGAARTAPGLADATTFGTGEPST